MTGRYSTADYYRVTECVCEDHGINIAVVLGTPRTPKASYARREAMAKIYAICQGATHQKIAHFFARDVSTVTHAIKAYREAGQ